MIRAHRQVPPIIMVALGCLCLTPNALRAQEPGQPPPDPADAQCRILGRIVNADTGDPIAGASAWLERAGDGGFLAGGSSTRDGGYVIETSVCEAATLRVTMLGYVEASRTVAFDAPGQDRRITIRLERDPVEVEELRVEVPRSLRLRDVGFYARKAWVESTGDDLANFYDPEEVEGRSAAIHTVYDIARTARVRWIYPPGAMCEGPSYYIDGTRFRSDSSAIRMLQYGLKPRDVEGIEIYRALSGAVPEEFRDGNANVCGAIVVWTKLGGPGEAPPIEVELCEPAADPLGISFGGVVTDRLTGVPLPATYVTLMTESATGEARELHTVADEAGEYRYCDLEAWPDAVRARYGTVTAEPFRIDQDRAEPGYWAIDLRVGVIRPGSVVGTVASPGTIPEGTEIALETAGGEERMARPDERGYFEIRDLVPNDYVLIVRRAGQVVLQREVSIRSGATEVVTLELGDSPEANRE